MEDLRFQASDREQIFNLKSSISNLNFKLLVPLEEERRVRTAEPERVRQRVADRHRPLHMWHVIEIALRVGVVQIDGRWRDLMVHGQRRDAGLEPAGAE